MSDTDRTTRQPRQSSILRTEDDSEGKAVKALSETLSVLGHLDEDERRRVILAVATFYDVVDELRTQD